MSSVKFSGSLEQRSTTAAREFVDVVRRRMRSEVAMHGERAKGSGSYRDLERTISPEEIRRVWPHADVDQVLREDDDNP